MNTDKHYINEYESTRPLILVSNDDSINALGVHVLIDRLLAFGDVVAVCPEGPQSGKSMALTVNDPLRVTRLEDYHGAQMYKVSGTPVDCIKLSMHYILKRRPALVVGGINHGSNVAVNVLYSGTMGVAMEGAVFGIPSIGFSLTDHNPNADFTPCLRAVDILVEDTMRNGLPEGVCLNVNIPNISTVPAEMRVVEPCRGRWNDEYKEYTDPFGRKFYMLSGMFENAEPENENTDEWCVTHGIISVVPVVADRSVAATPAVPWLASSVRRYNAE